MNPAQFAIEHVVFHEPVKNQIFNDSTFTRISYSNNIITSSGIHLKMDFKGTTIDKRFNKKNIQYNIYNNAELLAVVQEIERSILSAIPTKSHVYGLHSDLSSGRITVHDCADTILLKISGIWETDTSCGITYKFV